MPPVVINLNSADDQRDVVHRAVQALAEGRLVAIPTETVYGLAASALDDAAVARLVAAKHRLEGHPVTLAIKSADDALDYVPSLSPLGRRLARRCWPGPVTLVLDDDHPDSLVKQLPAGVRKVVCPNGSIGLRVPAHPVVLSILRLSPGPIALSSANRTGQPDSVTAAEVVAQLGDDVELVVDDGRSRFAQPSSVVRVRDNAASILRSGVIAEPTLRRLSSFMALIVCTGNTCRSPMAEVMLRHRLAERLKVPAGQLEDHGVLVQSAGIAAVNGGRPTIEAIDAMAARGLDLTAHESQPMTERLMRFADVILTMTRSHREAIIAQWPEAAERASVLSRDGTDVADPIGGPPEMYLRCAQQIDAQLDQWIHYFEAERLLPESGD